MADYIKKLNERNRLRRQLFIANWVLAPAAMKKSVNEYIKNPTSSNLSYIIGYLTALNQHYLLTLEQHAYWTAFVAEAKSDPTLAKFVTEQDA